ncbi:MAG: hypothetical protein MZV64_01820 [Ignavibacteriales bacterium]|nr:hypothetical protein [Ignavibacteriales bacterium]
MSFARALQPPALNRTKNGPTPGAGRDVVEQAVVLLRCRAVAGGRPGLPSARADGKQGATAIGST